MNETGKTLTSFIDTVYVKDVHDIVQQINAVLKRFPDKDWNYSRITLTAVEVSALESPYLLECELVDLGTPQGGKTLKDVHREVTWGDHHSSELGIVELISLRVNKALLAVTSAGDFVSGHPLRKQHPVLRLVKRDDLLAAKVSQAIWYRVEEVSGDEFDSR